MMDNLISLLGPNFTDTIKLFRMHAQQETSSTFQREESVGVVKGLVWSRVQVCVLLGEQSQVEDT